MIGHQRKTNSACPNNKNNINRNDKRERELSPDQNNLEQQRYKERQALKTQQNYINQLQQSNQPNLSAAQFESIKQSLRKTHKTKQTNQLSTRSPSTIDSYNQARRLSRLNSQSPEILENERIRSSNRRKEFRNLNALQQVIYLQITIIF